MTSVIRYVRFGSYLSWAELNVILELCGIQVRVETLDYFPIGTILLFDAVHVPYGCSVSATVAPIDNLLTVTHSNH